MERVASNIIGAIYEAASGEDRWRVLYEELRRSVRIDYADFVTGHRSVERGPPNNNDVVRFREGWFEVRARSAFQDREGMLQSYLANFSLLDPLSVPLDEQLSRFVELPNIAADGTIKPYDLGGDWTRTTYYNDFLKRYGVEHPARFITDISPSEQLVANVNWSVAYEEVSADERRLVNLAVTHAARVLDIESRASPLLGGVETLLRTLDLVDEAAFVLNAQMRVETMNRAARDLLDVETAVTLHAGTLRLADAVVEERIRRRMADPSPALDRTEFLLGGLLGPASLRTQLNPVCDHGISGKASHFLLLIDARNAARAGRLLMRAVLTLRERQAMIALAALGSEKAAAEALGVSLNTFRTHRRTSYSKLGISSRPELLNILDS